MNDFMRKFSIIGGLFFVAWILIILVTVNFMLAGFYAWAGIIGGIIAFVIAFLSIIFWKHKEGRDITEINMIPAYVTCMYLVITVIINTVFCFMAYLNYPKAIPLAVNAALLIGFTSIRLFTAPYREHVARTAEHTAEKVYNVNTLSAQLGELISMAKDEMVVKKLKKLKEQLDYSSNVSQTCTEDLENIFRNHLNEIGCSLTRNETPDKVMPKIDAAEQIWKRRNSISAATR